MANCLRNISLYHGTGCSGELATWVYGIPGACVGTPLVSFGTYPNGSLVLYSPTTLPGNGVCDGVKAMAVFPLDDKPKCWDYSSYNVSVFSAAPVTCSAGSSTQAPLNLIIAVFVAVFYFI